MELISAVLVVLVLATDTKERENYLIAFFRQRIHRCVALQMVSDRFRHVHLENGKKRA